MSDLVLPFEHRERVDSHQDPYECGVYRLLPEELQGARWRNVHLLDYLHRTGAFAPPHPAARPGIILLDLNMPRMDGKEALGEIRSDPALRDIPVVVLTTSKADEDVLRSYSLGANSFIVKPVSFEGLVDVMRSIDTYWFEMVRLPTRSRAA